jgi:hypothetical protein
VTRPGTGSHRYLALELWHAERARGVQFSYADPLTLAACYQASAAGLDRLADDSRTALGAETWRRAAEQVMDAADEILAAAGRAHVGSGPSHHGYD